jgi:hypothetical protein
MGLNALIKGPITRHQNRKVNEQVSFARTYDGDTWSCPRIINARQIWVPAYRGRSEEKTAATLMTLSATTG